MLNKNRLFHLFTTLIDSGRQTKLHDACRASNLAAQHPLVVVSVISHNLLMIEALVFELTGEIRPQHFI